MEILLGRQENILWLSVDKEGDFDRMRDHLSRGVQQVENGKGVVLLTDMFGGSASNAALSLMENHHIDVIAGMNLPMLMRLVELRKKVALEVAVQSAYEAGKNYVKLASKVLNGDHN